MQAPIHPVAVAIEALPAGWESWIWTARTIGEPAVRMVEDLLGVPFPADYRAFVIDHGCAAVASADGAEGIEIYGLSRACPTPMDVRVRHEHVTATGHAHLVPVLGPLRGAPTLAFDRDGSFHRLTSDGWVPVAGTFTTLALAALGASHPN